LRLSPSGIVLAILCAMYFLFFLNRTNLAIAGPAIQADLGLSNADLGLVFAAFGIPYAVLQPLGGAIGDRFGPRTTLAVCTLIVCVATGWVGAAGGVVSLFLARVLLGLGEGAGFPTATRAMAAWTPKGQWGFAQGITHTFSRVGGAAASLIVAGLIAMFAWRVAFFLLIPITLAWVIVCSGITATIPEPIPRSRRNCWRGSPRAKPEPPNPKSRGWRWGAAWRL